MRSRIRLRAFRDRHGYAQAIPASVFDLRRARRPRGDGRAAPKKSHVSLLKILPVRRNLRRRPPNPIRGAEYCNRGPITHINGRVRGCRRAPYNYTWLWLIGGPTRLAAIRPRLLSATSRYVGLSVSTPGYITQP